MIALRHFLPGLVVPSIDDTVINVNPEGEILREISVLETIYNSDNVRFIFH